MNAYETVLDAVHRAGLKTHNERRDSTMAQCPVHDDDNPSLSIAYSNGKVLLNCHGCQADARETVAALGLEMSDLFDEEPDREKNNVIVAEYPYVDGFTGEVLFVKQRYYPKTFRIKYFDAQGNDVWRKPAGTKDWLYHAPELKKAMDDGQPIWLVEGEADVHAIEYMGGAATTQPNGAGHGKWQEFHSSLLRRAVEVRIVVDLDLDRDDGSNAGRDYALEVRDALLAHGIKVTMWKSPAGKDAYDALKAGKTLADFEKYPMPKNRVDGVMGDELAAKEFPPLIYAVDKILPQGVAILAASPKAGKSFIAVDMAVGVAIGGRCLSSLKCTLGDVLYVGFEDSERRLKSRIELLVEGDWPDLSRIEFQTIDSGWVGGLTGMAWMEEWANNVEDPRLIVIDTLGKAEPDIDESKNRYLAEQELMLRYKRFADRHGCTVLMVHHNRKSEGDDWLDKFSGSKGLTGGADTLLYVDYKRGERDGFLRVEGRDVVADDVPIHKVQGRPFWRATTAPDTFAGVWAPAAPVSDSQKEILRFLDGKERAEIPLLRAAFPGEQLNDDLGNLMKHGLIHRDGESVWLDG